MGGGGVVQRRARPGLVALVAALLAVPAAVLVVSGTARAAPTKVLTVTTATANPTVAFSGMDGNPARTFDFDGDGDEEIVVQNDNQYAYVLDSRTGAILAQLKTTFPASWGARSFNGPEAYAEDNQTYLVLANSAAYVTKYRFDKAASSAASFVFVKLWERRQSDCFSNPGADAKPVLADLDRDGRMDIIQDTEESGVYALRGDGTLLWKQCIGGGNAESTVADINLDGKPDVVHVSDGGQVAVLEGSTGAIRWTYSFLAHFNLNSGSIPIGAAVGQLDQVGGLDIVVALRDSHDATNWTNDHAMLAALSTGGSLLWATQDTSANPLTYGHPVIADAANDGTPEVYWGDWNTVGHKPPPVGDPNEWMTTGPAHYYRFDNKGNKVWMTTLNTYWSNKDIPLVDVDGDGDFELYVNGPGPGGDGLWELDAATGAATDFLQIGPYKVARAAVFADLWGTGTLQFVLEVGAATSSGANGVLVYDTGHPYSAKWPHPPGPWRGEVVPPPPPPAGCFGATFTVKSPNEWWEEVSVAPDTQRTLVGVQMRLDGGAWMDMTHASWGAWTLSQHAPAGTKVEFAARDAGNLAAQSLPFTWLDGTLSQRGIACGGTTSTTTTSTTSSTTTTTTSSSTTTTSGTGTSTGPFDATFSGVRGNEWWVQAQVAGNAPIAGVDVRLNGGAWQPVTKQSWGWGVSYHIVQGTVVQLRATSATGATDLSECRQWIPPSGQDAAIVACVGTTTSTTSTTGSTTTTTTSSGFSATFSPKAVGNDWWVEADVAANAPLSGVDAQLNGGAWTALTHQDWGSWAKSINAPNGTTIVFRATSTDGSVATSQPVVWT